MKYINDFRDPEIAIRLKDKIHALSEQIPATPEKPIRLMEFCGGHTHTIFRFGIAELLPEKVEMVHGPGCPVCVLPMSSVDMCVSLARKPEVIMTTFGDAMRVPGTEMSLQQAKALGADIRMVYSPTDALALAQSNPDREVVFFALGFETTMPSTALTLLKAAQEEINNFSLLCHHITTTPTIESVLGETHHQLDGILAPGHVSMVMGTDAFQTLAEQFEIPIVITGFEPLDILSSIQRLLELKLNDQNTMFNNYERVVKSEGNLKSLQAMQEVFDFSRQAQWRGLGLIEDSGVAIKAKYSHYDAIAKFNIGQDEQKDESPLQCADVLKGIIKPVQCELFAKQCTPESPQGALMVSSEGACAAYYQYQGMQYQQQD